MHFAPFQKKPNAVPYFPPVSLRDGNIRAAQFRAVHPGNADKPLHAPHTVAVTIMHGGNNGVNISSVLPKAGQYQH